MRWRAVVMATTDSYLYPEVFQSLNDVGLFPVSPAPQTLKLGPVDILNPELELFFQVSLVRNQFRKMLIRLIRFLKI